MSHFSGPWLSSFINGRESGGHNKQKEDWKGAERSGNKANYSKALVSDHGTHTNKSLEIVTNLVVPLPAKANKQEAWGSKAYGSVCFCFQNPLRMFMAFLGQDCKVELEQTQVLHQLCRSFCVVCKRINQYASRVESTKLTKDWQTSIKILSDFGI